MPTQISSPVEPCCQQPHGENVADSAIFCLPVGSSQDGPMVPRRALACRPVVTTSPTSGHTDTAAQQELGTAPQRPPGSSAHQRFFDDGSTRTDFKRARIHPLSSNPSEVSTDLRGARPHVTVNGLLAKTDAHFHPTNYSQRGLTPRDMLRAMDQLGIRNCVLMPIPTTIVAPTEDAYREQLPDHHCGQRYYIPEKFKDLTADGLTEDVRHEIIEGRTELMLDSQVDHSSASRLRASGLSDAQKSRLDPMITGLHLGGQLSPQSLLEKLKQNKGVFTGIGEVTIHKEIVEDLFAGRSQANLVTNIQSFKELAEVAGVVGMPVVLHCDVDRLGNNALAGLDGYEPTHLKGLKALFGSPELKSTDLVWAHAGGLGRFVQESGDRHTHELQRMLDENPRLHIDISWSHVANQLRRSPEALQRWGRMINENPNRFLIGSDSLSPIGAGHWNETFKLHGELVRSLSSEAREKLLNGNYERVFVAARPRVREFEDKVLSDHFERSQLLDVNGPWITAASIKEYIRAHDIRLTPRTAVPRFS